MQTNFFGDDVFDRSPIVQSYSCVIRPSGRQMASNPSSLFIYECFYVWSTFSLSLVSRSSLSVKQWRPFIERFSLCSDWDVIVSWWMRWCGLQRDSDRAARDVAAAGHYTAAAAAGQLSQLVQLWNKSWTDSQAAGLRVSSPHRRLQTPQCCVMSACL